VDRARERRRRQKKITAMAMRTAATSPPAPPTMAAVFELLPPVGGSTVSVGDIVEDALEEDVGVTDGDRDKDRPAGLRVEPGPNSGESIKHGVRQQRDGKEKIGETNQTMLTNVGIRFVGVPIVLILGVCWECCDYGATGLELSDVQ